MFRTSISKAAAGLAGAALFSALAFVAAPAWATTVNISGLTCTSTGTPPNDTLTCNASGGSGPPTGCAVSGPTTASTGQNTAISVACTGGAALTSYAWTGGSCANQASSSCTANESGATQVQYGVTVSNGSGSIAATPWTVTWVSGGVAPSGCTATANPAGPLAAGGGSTTISVSCASGAPTSYSWSASPAVAGLQPTTTVGSQGPLTITQSTTFSVTPSNGTGAGNVASVLVSVQVGGGGGGSLANCTAQGISVLGGSAINIPWGVSQGAVSNSSGSFGNNIAWVFQMTVPANTPNTSVSGIFEVAENGGQGTPKNLTISKTPCDFRVQDTSGASGPLQVCRNGTTCDIYFQVGPPTFFGNFAGLSAGTTYYINVRNYDDFSGPGYNCPGGNCPAVYNVQPTR